MNSSFTQIINSLSHTVHSIWYFHVGVHSTTTRCDSHSLVLSAPPPTMASVTVNVTYGYQSKKISIPKSSTVGQLASQAATAFNINGDPSLEHKGKRLDPSLPLRFTQLVQNSTVKLNVEATTTLTPSAIAIKIATPESSTVVKTTNDVTIEAALKLAEANLQTSIIKPGIEVLLMNTVYQDLSLPLKQVSGSATNTVMRVRYPVSNVDRQKEQQEVVAKQLAEQRARNEAQRVERERLEAERQRRIYELKKEIHEQQTELLENDDEMMEAREEEQIENYESQHPVESRKDSQTKSKPTTADESISPLAPMKDGDQLYVPTNQPMPIYENPEEDYTLTVDKAKLYHKLVQQLGKRTRPTQHEPIHPRQYLIRIKFPDRNLLQLNFVSDADSVKLGQIVKRIDEVILDKWIGKYHLKLGYPPFQQVPLSFDTNGSRLHDLPQFFSGERIALIWEPALVTIGVASSGPFLKEGAISDQLSTRDLPEVKSESQRGNFADSQEPRETKSSTTPTSTTKSNSGKLVPKWLQIGKK